MKLLQKTLLILTLVVFPVTQLLAAEATCAPKSDAQYNQLIVGKWYDNDALTLHGKTYDGEQTIEKDGKLTITLFNHENHGDVLFTAEAAWNIKDGIVYEQGISMKPELLDVKDMKTKDKILCLDEKTLKLESLDDGKIYIRNRE